MTKNFNNWLKKSNPYLVLFIVCFGLFFNVPYIHGQPVNFTLDFETDDLRGWTKKGNAFDYQPTLGDNPTARNRGQPSHHQGTYWIGTYEKYQGRPNQRSGDIQGDRPQGTLTSARFIIPKGTLSFLIGGGNSPKTQVELIIIQRDTIEGVDIEKPVKYASGLNTETMHRVTWELTPYAGKTGTIRIVDASSEPWGHINVDDFRFSSIPAYDMPTIPVVPSDRKVEVPDLIRRNISEAGKILDRVQLRLGEVNKRHSDQEAGTVVRQSPEAHSRVKRGTPVNIWIAESEIVEVPNLVRRHVDKAEGILSKLKLRLGEIAKRDSDQEVGTILQQEPVAGNRVSVGTSVNLLIATRRMVQVPNLVGQSIGQAKEILKETRLQIGSLAEEVSNRKPGTVFQQNPPAGIKVVVDSPVNLWIATKIETPALIHPQPSEPQPSQPAPQPPIPSQSPEDGHSPTPIPWRIIIIGVLVLAGGYYLFSRIRKAGKAIKDVTPEIQIKPHRDTGIQQIESDTNIQSDFEIRLKPILDHGKQDIEAEGSLIIGERRDHE